MGDHQPGPTGHAERVRQPRRPHVPQRQGQRRCGGRRRHGRHGPRRPHRRRRRRKPRKRRRLGRRSRHRHRRGQRQRTWQLWQPHRRRPAADDQAAWRLAGDRGQRRLGPALAGLPPGDGRALGREEILRGSQDRHGNHGLRPVGVPGRRAYGEGRRVQGERPAGGRMAQEQAGRRGHDLGHQRRRRPSPGQGIPLRHRHARHSRGGRHGQYPRHQGCGTEGHQLLHGEAPSGRGIRQGRMALRAQGGRRPVRQRLVHHGPSSPPRLRGSTSTPPRSTA